MRKKKRVLIIATHNAGKLKEIKGIFKDTGIKVVSLRQFGAGIKIKEDGKTFFDNAFKKGSAVSKLYPEDYVVGEDSGLEVYSLNGAPGVYSRRYAGKNSSDLDNNIKLLKKMRMADKRCAQYYCCLALVKGGRLVRVFRGRLKGVINREMKGRNGFGYDPLFYIRRYRKTAAQLSLREKNKISHRAVAFQRLKKYLKQKDVF